MDSLGIPTVFSVGMEWVWGLKSNSHGRPGICNCVKRNKEKNGKDMWKWSEDKEGRQRRDGCMKGSVKEVYGRRAKIERRKTGNRAVRISII